MLTSDAVHPLQQCPGPLNKWQLSLSVIMVFWSLGDSWVMGVVWSIRLLGVRRCGLFHSTCLSSNFSKLSSLCMCPRILLSFRDTGTKNIVFSWVFVDPFVLRVQGTLNKLRHRHHISKASIRCLCLAFIVQVSRPYKGIENTRDRTKKIFLLLVIPLSF